MASDPRGYVKGILTPINVALDNGVTHADVAVIYAGGPENLRRLFYVNQYHAVVTIIRHSDRESGAMKRVQEVPLRYDGEIMFHVTAVDRTGVTATKLLNKIRRQIIALIEADAQWSDATVRVQSNRGFNKVMGGFDPLFADEYVVTFRPLGRSFPLGAVTKPPPVVSYYGFELITALLKFEDGYERI